MRCITYGKCDRKKKIAKSFSEIQMLLPTSYSLGNRGDYIVDNNNDSESLRIAKVVLSERRLRVQQVHSQVTSLRRCVASVRRQHNSKFDVTEFYSGILKAISARSDRMIVMNSRILSEIHAAEAAIESYETRDRSKASRAESAILAQEMDHVREAIEETRRSNMRKRMYVERINTAQVVTGSVSTVLPRRSFRRPTIPAPVQPRAPLAPLCRQDVMVYVTQSVELRKLEKERDRLKRRIVGG